MPQQLQDAEFVVGHDATNDTWFVINQAGCVVLAGVSQASAEQAARRRNDEATNAVYEK